jgi:hypothetical protein
VVGAVGGGAPVAGRARSTWRRLVSSALVVMASALALAAVTPDASGILAWTGAAVDASLAPWPPRSFWSARC